MTIELHQNRPPAYRDELPSSLADINAEHLNGLVDRLLVDEAAAGQSRIHGPGLVVWITGLSGAGKTTVAGLLAPCFQEAGRPCVTLDGDHLRALLRNELGLETGHDREQRLTLARLYGRLCQAVATRGCDVLCATVSMFHDVRAWNRAHIPNYLEVYLRVPLDELRRRDPKGLYARSAAGEVAGMVGVEVPAEEPSRPDLVIDHHPDRTPAVTAHDIWRTIRERHAARG
ncbi:adenylyl-sulfate kinase [Azospirillum isscasi]|uniref:Adenylyl-sulfate kinase n=1 Tax=Azospirillum isscasi TaxID=3053926 RepID=A0ABU0WKX6_9PROT|nr:adenylyl-sulfate kinase [Azospirillum isscasi]MDQ2104239.1 adenylyl-sulfate kinase [Azospirillum isscasi]